jgi:small-conductance mechanosensitive channel/CRP-like cAMP-binding protein
VHYQRLALPALLAALAFVVHHFSQAAATEDGNIAPGAAASLIFYASGIVGWLSLAWLGSRCFDLLIQRIAATLVPTQQPRLLNDLVRASLFGLAAIAILVFVFQQAATGLIATSSVLIAVVGFALRYVISDVFSGIFLNFDHPYRIGDWIELGAGVLGKVTEITWRSTRLITRDGTTVILPNGLIATGRLINYSAPAASFRTSLRFWVEAGLPVDRVKAILMTAAFVAARSYPELRPDVLVQECGESGVLYVVRFWVPDAGEENVCRDTVVSAVVLALQRNGIEFAAPKRQLTPAPAEGAARSLAPPSPAELLESCDLFHVFTADERVALSHVLTEERVRAGDVVFHRGAPGGSLYFVADGALEVRALSPDGREVTVDRMVPGDVFGEISLLTGETRSATIVALSDALLYQVTKVAIEPFLWRRTELFDALAKLMVERRKHNKDRLHALRDAREAALGADDLVARFRSFFGWGRRSA